MVERKESERNVRVVCKVQHVPRGRCFPVEGPFLILCWNAFWDETISIITTTKGRFYLLFESGPLARSIRLILENLRKQELHFRTVQLE